MNAIIITRNGVMDTPILIKKNTDADAVYENIVEDLLGDDFDDIVGGFFDDFVYDRVNSYLETTQGITINYFQNLD
jgi:hypothetical protein